MNSPFAHLTDAERERLRGGKPWFDRVPVAAGKGSPSVDGTAWARRDYVAIKQRELELRDWLAANAHIFEIDRPDLMVSPTPDGPAERSP